MLVLSMQIAQLVLFGQEGVMFFENNGQILNSTSPSNSIRFNMNCGHTQIFLSDEGIIYQFSTFESPKYFDGIPGNNRLRSLAQEFKSTVDRKIETHRMDMLLVGCNKNAIVTKEGKSKDYLNFYNKNVFDVHSYEKVTYHDIYPGIDWVLYQKDSKLKYDFILNPGADPSLIKIQFKYQEELLLNSDGSITLKNSLGSITEEKPISYQGNKEVATRFRKNGDVISFELGKYNRDRALIIDPSVFWATYYGGSGNDYGAWTSTDTNGDVYMVGSTYSSFNIAAGGHQTTIGGSSDAYLVKFDKNGNRLWATYYGDSGSEIGYYCCVDQTGNVYLMGGQTNSNSNIASGGHQNAYGGGNSDAFLVKFNSNGTRLWATYYGGSGDETGQACSTDAAGNVYLAGTTTSTADIASGGFLNSLGGQSDAFLVKFNSSGIRQWGTYYGSTSNENGFSCATDQTGNIYLAGLTESPSGISSGGHQNIYGTGGGDAMLVKFNTNGQRLWATYYGSAGFDYGASCAIDNSGNIYLTGVTSSTANIYANGHQNSLGGQDDAFLVKFNTSGIRQWGTYYGGNLGDYANAVTSDASGNVYIAGLTSSSTNISASGYQNTIGGGNDAFFVKFNTNGARIWGSYYGGVSGDTGDSFSIDYNGSLYLVGNTSSNAGISLNGHQGNFGGGIDGYLAKFCDTVPVQPSPISGNNIVCSSTTPAYLVNAIPGTSFYQWNYSGGWSGTSTLNTISFNPQMSGTLSVSVVNGCGTGIPQTTSITLVQTPTLTSQATNTILCSGETTTISVNGADAFSWNPAGSGSIYVASPALTTTYNIIGINSGLCSDTISVVIQATPCTEIKEQNQIIRDFNIYPNPANNLVDIEHNSSEKANLEIYNLLGEKIKSAEISAVTTKFDLTDLVSGVYFFVFRKDDRVVETVKVVKD